MKEDYLRKISLLIYLVARHEFLILALILHFVHPIYLIHLIMKALLSKVLLVRKRKKEARLKSVL